MSLNRVVLCALSFALVFTAKISFAGASGKALPAAQSSDAKAMDDKAVLKMNEDCNTAELKADVAMMDKCELDDFTHTHSGGQVEHKAEFIKGVGSGAHHFLMLEWSDVHVRTYGDSAVVDGHQHLRADNLGKIADYNLDVMTVWVKKQGQWREAAWIACKLSGTPLAISQQK